MQTRVASPCLLRTQDLRIAQSAVKSSNGMRTKIARVPNYFLLCFEDQIQSVYDGFV
jgi:hypothetical protein